MRARLRAVEAQSDAALARYQRSLLLAQEDAGNALNQLAEHQRRLVALFQSATHGANALEIANERYRAGAGSYLAVLENQRALYQIREELAQAETASFVNVIALYKALGWGSGDLAPGAGQLAAGETPGPTVEVPIQALAATIMRVSIGRSTIRSTAKPPRPSRSTTSSVVR